MGILEWFFGFELFPAIAQYAKFRNDAKFNEGCVICKNLQMRGENMSPLDICGIVDVCKNDSRKTKKETKCFNFLEKEQNG